jgi:hypothetical protein
MYRSARLRIEIDLPKHVAGRALRRLEPAVGSTPHGGCTRRCCDQKRHKECQADPPCQGRVELSAEQLIAVVYEIEESANDQARDD